MDKILGTYTDSRDNNFNLIRVIASLLVLFTHSFALVEGSSMAEPLKLSLGTTLGTIAVDIFFITSGFLIAGSFFNKNSILSFIWARILRIYPAIIVSMIFSVFVIGLIFTKYSIFEYLSNIDIYKFFFTNIILYFRIEYSLLDIFENNPIAYTINGSLWTLPFEIKMYIYLAIIGTILILFQKFIKKPIVKISFFIIVLFALIQDMIYHFYFNKIDASVYLFYMFFVGSAFYIFRDYIYLSFKLFLIMLVILLFSSFDREVFFVIYTLFLPYMVFFLAYIPSGIIREFNKLGDYSYGIYIYAFPIQQSIVSIYPNISIVNMVIVSSFTTFILAILSWHLVEKRFLKMKIKRKK